MAPVRLGLALFALAAVATVTSLRGSDEAMVWVYDHITHPYHAFMSRLCSHVSFSVAELFYAVVGADQRYFPGGFNLSNT